VRELYRWFVKTSPLGRDDHAGALMVYVLPSLFLS
jgi:hypothetical protein